MLEQLVVGHVHSYLISSSSSHAQLLFFQWGKCVACEAITIRGQQLFFLIQYLVRTHVNAHGTVGITIDPKVGEQLLDSQQTFSLNAVLKLTFFDVNTKIRLVKYACAYSLHKCD